MPLRSQSDCNALKEKYIYSISTNPRLAYPSKPTFEDEAGTASILIERVAYPASDFLGISGLSVKKKKVVTQFKNLSLDKEE